MDGTSHVEWDEAVDRTVDLPPLVIPPGGTAAVELPFHLEGGSEAEPVHAADGTLAGRFIRERLAIDGMVRVATAPAAYGSPYVKVAVTVENATPWSNDASRRADVVAQSLVAVHTMLAVDGATFVSLLDPPDAAAEAALACRSVGTYPVLIGADDVVLSSPIILYDHPEVADQSPGDLYDSLEIDEILALRVMTLTEAEKAEARGTDARAAAIIDRCDALSPEAMGRLHGQMRPVEPEWLTVNTPGNGGRTVVGPGLRPVRRPVDGLGARGRRRRRARIGGPAAPVRTGGCTGHVPRRPTRHRGRCVRRCRRGRPSGRHTRRRSGGTRVELAGSLPLLPPRGGRAAARVARQREPAVTDRILIAGIGNIFLSDDAFGMEVAHRLSGRALPDGVRVEDYGIRGVHLAYDLLEGYDALVLVDAVPMGEPPGTLAVIQPEPEALSPSTPESGAPPVVDAHTMSPDIVLATLTRLGGSVGRIVIIGCQPGDLDEGIGLSPAVESAVAAAVDLCLEVVAGIAQPAERGIHP